MRLKLFSALALCCLTFAAGAGELRDRADDFIDAHNELLRSRNEVAAGRLDMAAKIDDNDKLKDATKEFFNDRADIEKFASRKAEARDVLFESTSVSLPPLVKATKATGVLQSDTQSFVNAFQKFLDKDAETQAAVAAIAQALTQPDDTQINTAAAAYFTARRERRSAKLQWQSDLKSMKKLVKFKNTFKALKFDSDNLKGYVQEYLADRAAWETLGTQIQTDFNNLKSAVAAPDSLPSAVTAYLNDKAARRAKAQELAKDRQGMLRNNPIKGFKSFFKGLFANGTEGKAAIDEDETELEQAIDHNGI